jgi:DNA-binding transcriptional LysR family regulator
MRPAAWRLFAELADAGSITRVAQARNAAQSHISRQLGELEHLCGARLFSRHGRGIALSELGAWVLPRVHAWLAETDQLESDIRTGSGVPIGEVRVAMLPSAIQPLATSVIARVRDRYPLVRLSVREGQGSQIDDWLDAGRIDLGIGYRYENDVREGDHVLARVDTYLVGPPGDALTRRPAVRFSKLQRLPLVLPCRPSAWRDTLDAVSHKLGFSLNVVMEADSLALQCEMAASGAGYTILGPFAIADALRAGRVQAAHITDPGLPRVVTLRGQQRSAISLAQRVVADLIREAARDMAGLAKDIRAGQKPAKTAARRNSAGGVTGRRAGRSP